MDSTVNAFTKIIQEDLSAINNDDELSSEEKEGFIGNLEIVETLTSALTNYVKNEMSEAEKEELAVILNNAGLLDELTQDIERKRKAKKILKNREKTCGDTSEYYEIFRKQTTIATNKKFAELLKFGCWNPIVSIYSLIHQVKSYYDETTPVVLTDLRLSFLEEKSEYYLGDKATICWIGDFESLSSYLEMGNNLNDLLNSIIKAIKQESIPCMDEIVTILEKYLGIDKATLYKPLFNQASKREQKGVIIDPGHVSNAQRFLYPKEASNLVWIDEDEIGLYEVNHSYDKRIFSQYMEVENSIADMLEKKELEIRYTVSVYQDVLLDENNIISEPLVFTVKNRKPEALDIQEQWNDSGRTEIKIPSMKYDKDTDSYKKVYPIPVYDGTKDNDSIQKVEIVEFPKFGKLYDWMDDGIDYLATPYEYTVVGGTINYRLDSLDAVPEEVEDDSFTYRIFDGAEWSDEATVTILFVSICPDGYFHNIEGKYCERWGRSIESGCLSILKRSEGFYRHEDGSWEKSYLECGLGTYIQNISRSILNYDMMTYMI